MLHGAMKYSRRVNLKTLKIDCFILAFHRVLVSLSKLAKYIFSTQKIQNNTNTIFSIATMILDWF